MFSNHAQQTICVPWMLHSLTWPWASCWHAGKQTHTQTSCVLKQIAVLGYISQQISDFWGTFPPPQHKDYWLLYPSPVSYSSALPVTPGFCHHWGHPAKRNPNQLELDQLEAESSNKIQQDCSPGNQGFCIPTHLLCPRLGPNTDVPVTVTSPCSWPHSGQHCHPTTCALLLSKAVQHCLHHLLPSLFTWKEQALFEVLSVNSV